MVGMILPEKVIGIIGGGQLGKMLAIAAQTLGFKVVIWSEEENCPACGVATSTIIGKYTDKNKLKLFIQQIDIATVETEHIPLFILKELAKVVPLYPDVNIIGTAQNRKKEKQWLTNNHFPIAPFQIISSIEDIITFQQHFGEIVVKTATGGYDGKGQFRLSNQELTRDEEDKIINWLENGDELIAEAWLAIRKEFSVIAARNISGSFVSFPIMENEHRNQILYRTIVPARIDESITNNAIKISQGIMEKLDYVGLLCIEYFYDEQGKVYINELAPRPHNSGHYTLDAAITSQFEQTIRAITGFPLGSIASLSPSVMINLLGEDLENGFILEKILAEPSAKLHLYGKKEAREKRKMGHFTTLAKSMEEALRISEDLYLSLKAKV